ncbi:MAG: AMP-binding protein [bacterium]|nr:AMP-binding protein [bacterium]
MIADGCQARPDCLETRIRRAASRPHGLTLVGSAARGGAPRVSWAGLHEEARGVAANLQVLGVAPGDHVAVLGLTSRMMVTAIQAVWLAGACLTVLPLPLRAGGVEEFLAQIRALLGCGDIGLLLLDPDLAAFYRPAPGDPRVVLLGEVQPGPGRATTDDLQEVPEDSRRLAILQFTSGSTSDPKGVMLPHHVVAANLDAMVAAAGIEPGDTLVSWAPLYHDMGLIGLLSVPMTIGCELVLASPQDFLSSPGDWMRWLSEHRGTVTAGPNFSWVLATRALRRMNDTGERLDLSTVRLALSGAEPVDPDAVEAFVATAAPHGFRPEAVFCGFGMAEVTLGGTFPPLMRGMACDTVDRVALESEGVAHPADPGLPTTRRLPLLGRPVPGLEMRVCDPQTGEELAERQVGELELRGTSVTTGYYKRPDLRAGMFHDGWLRTGDLAYLVPAPDGGSPELVLCGRLKDVIIIGGRNIFPEDLERAVGAMEGVRAGNVIAFGVGGDKGKESIVVVAEARTDDPSGLGRSIRRRVLQVCGVTPREVVLVAPGTVPKTSSGKLQRSLCRERFLRGALAPL